MADDSDIVRILIEFGLSEEAADRAVERMAELKAAGQDMNSHLPEGAELWKKYKGVLNQTSEEGIGKLIHNHRLLHLVMQETGAEVPGLGLLLKNLFNPEVLGLVGGIALIELYFKQQEKVEEKLKAMTEAAQKFNDEMRKVYFGGPNADERFTKMAAAMAEMKEHGRGVLEELNQELAPLRYAQAAHEMAAKYAELVKRNMYDTKELAIELAQALGMLNPDEAARRMAEIKAKEKNDAAKAAEEKAASDVKYKETEVGRQEKAQGALGSQEQVTAAKVNADIAKENAERIVNGHEEVIKQWKESAREVSGGFKFAKGSTAATVQRELDSGKLTPEQLQGIENRVTAAFVANPGLYNREQTEGLKTLIELNKQRFVEERKYADTKESLPGLEGGALAADDAYQAWKRLNDELVKNREELARLKAAQEGAHKTTEETRKATTQQLAEERTKTRVDQGQSVESIFYGGAKATVSLKELLRRTGESEAQLVERGKKAETDRDAGRPLVGTEAKDIQNYQVYTQLKDAIQAFKDLETMIGANADQQYATLSSMLQNQSDLATKHKGLAAKVGDINRQIAELSGGAGVGR